METTHQAITPHAQGKVDYYDDTRAVPIQEVKRALSTLTYGSDVRVMFAACFLTGCRVSELDLMRPDMIFGDVLHFPLGKRQRSYRRIRLPPGFIRELKFMRASHPCTADKLFPIKSESFRRYFNRYARRSLGGSWIDKVLRWRNARENYEYKLQLNGLRKTYQTLLFRDKWLEYGDAGVAVDFTCKEMKHSSKNITTYHYIQNFDRVGVDKIGKIDPCKVYSDSEQSRLNDFFST